MSSINLGVNYQEVNKAFEAVKKLENLSSNIKPIELKIDITGDGAKLIQEQIRQIQGKDIKLNVDSTELNKFGKLQKTIIDDSGGITRVYKQINDGLININTTYQKTNESAEELKKHTIENLKTEKEIERLEKQRHTEANADAKRRREEAKNRIDDIEKEKRKNQELADAMAKGREKAQVKSQKESRTEELAQAKAINKAKEEEYKLKLKYEDSLAKTKKRVEDLTNSQKKRINAERELERIQKIDNLEDKTKALKSFNTEISRTQQQGKGFVSDISTAIQKTVSWATAMTLLYGTFRKFQEMIDIVKEMDSALTEYKKVSDLTGESLDKFVSKAVNMGKEVARTGKEMVEAATEFKKSGYTDEDSLQLAKIASMYQNIADEEMSAGDSAGFIISQMKAFNIEANDSVHVIDAVNEVSNKYAVSSADLANNLGIVSSTMAAGKTSYEETLGMMTAITEITRDANKAANGLKTISQRIRGVGEDADENLKSKLQPTLNSAGISIDILNEKTGEMASTWEILSAIADKWDTLTEAQRQNIGELVAGKHQITNFNALMQNFDVALSATTTAMDSMGSATTENGKVLESVEGKSKALQSAFEELALKTINSDLIKAVLDGGTVLARFASNDIGQTILVIGTLTAGLALLIKGFKLVTTAVDLYKTRLVAAILMSQGFTTSQALAIGANAGLTMSFQALTIAMLQNPLFWGAIAIAGIFAIIKTVDALTVSFEEQTEKVKQSTSAYEDSLQTISDTESELDKLSKIIKELESKKSLTIIEEENLENAKKQNEFLERRLEIEKEIAGIKEQQLITDSKDLMTKRQTDPRICTNRRRIC